MKTIQRSGAAVAVLVMALSIVTGCGGSSSGDDDASAGGGGAAASQSASADKAQRYSACMRKNGVPEFPDPENGRLILKFQKGKGVAPDSPEFKAAEQACKDLAPGGDDGRVASPEQQERMRKFSSCMRKNGVPDFPDPSGSGGLKITGVNPESPEFQSAMQACRELAPGGAP